jgi:hypothetical protein
MEALFSQLTLDIIGKAVFNYDFNSLTTNSPLIQAVYTSLKETEQRATDLLPYWKVRAGSRLGVAAGWPVQQAGLCSRLACAAGWAGSSSAMLVVTVAGAVQAGIAQLLAMDRLQHACAFCGHSCTQALECLQVHACHAALSCTHAWQPACPMQPCCIHSIHTSSGSWRITTTAMATATATATAP